MRPDARVRKYSWENIFAYMRETLAPGTRYAVAGGREKTGTAVCCEGKTSSVKVSMCTQKKCIPWERDAVFFAASRGAV